MDYLIFHGQLRLKFSLNLAQQKKEKNIKIYQESNYKSGWSSAGTCGFKGTRRGTPFVSQTAAANVIHTVVDQDMQRAKIMIKGPCLGRVATWTWSLTEGEVRHRIPHLYPVWPAPVYPMII